jgi:hypothetical protein
MEFNITIRYAFPPYLIASSFERSRPAVLSKNKINQQNKNKKEIVEGREKPEKKVKWKEERGARLRHARGTT